MSAKSTARCSRHDRCQAVNRESAADPRPRVALVHDWLTGMRGGEKVLEAICGLYPDAPLYSLVHARGQVSPAIERHRVRTSFVQRLPAAVRRYRQFLPLFPAAVELFDLDGFDLVISTSHCAVKSVVRPGRAIHVSYCHSPMRYAWDQFGAYFGPAQVGHARSQLFRPVMAALARWDRATAGRVDRYVANSRYVAERIRRYYNRESTVVYPPVDTAFYRPADDRLPSRSGFLVVSALVPYKRLDVAIDACRRLGAPLTIVGTGPELGRLRAMAGPDVTFLGWQSNEDIRDLYRRSTATLLPRRRGLRDGPGRGAGLRLPGRGARQRWRRRDGRRRRDRYPRARPLRGRLRRRAQPRAGPCLRRIGAARPRPAVFPRPLPREFSGDD